MREASWEKKELEPADAWGAFVSYRDAGPKRRLDQVAVAGIRPSMVQTRRWFKEWRWQARANAYDRWIDKVRLVERANVIRHDEQNATIERRVLFSQLRDLLAREIDKFLALSKATDMASAFEFKDIVKALDTLVKLERLEKGLSTENHVRYDKPKLSDDQFAAIERALEDAGEIEKPN